VPWYPDNLAWSMTTPKNVVRKFPPFSAFQKYLVSETSVGHITRQEVVSMIPPLLLDVRPGMTVLDMCAAPGSKSSQLLEMLHGGEEDRIRKVLRQNVKKSGLDLGPETEEEKNADLDVDPADFGRATGLLVANDAEYKRCHMLTHQLKRLSSANVLITNHDATQFPSIKLRGNPERPKHNVYLKFDRILADVPCSGDGTLRKNTSLWKGWVPGSGLGLHQTQIRILVRALQLLKAGGRVVYSTCSMNPVENESVIAAAIDRCGGPEKISILDCSDQLPELKRKPGLKTWGIMDKTGGMWNSWAEVEEELKKEDFVFPGKFVETMFPPPQGHACADLPLERCVRVYAHLQDTGGFFITVLEKNAEFKARPEKSGETRVQTASSETRMKQETMESGQHEVAAVDDQINGSGKRVREEEADATEHPSPKKVKAEADVAAAAAADDKMDVVQGEENSEDAIAAAPETTTTGENSAAPSASKPDVVSKPTERRPDTSIKYEDPFIFLAPEHEAIQTIKKAYRLSDRFPLDRFFVRNAMGEPVKAIYYVPELSKEILGMNDGKGIKFIHGGIKMFMRQDVPDASVCRWRIQAEGIPLIEGYVGDDRVLRLTKPQTLRHLLIEMFPKITEDSWKKLEGIGERVRDMEMGCHVLRIEPDGTPEGFQERMAIPLWKSIQSLNLMLPKEDRSALLLRLFNDTTPLVNNSLRLEKERERRQQELKGEGGGAAEFDALADEEEAGDAGGQTLIVDAQEEEAQDDDEVEGAAVDGV
jgi:multisite-specific tRNA:(cytosine-C5)-methyltransferase